MDGDWITVAVGAGAVVLGLLLLWIAVRVFGQALATAVDLFAWKAEHGFVGVALYATVRRAGLTILWAPLKIRDLTEDDWLNGLWPSAAILAPGFPGVFRAPIELFPLQDRAQAISYPEYCHTAAAGRFSWSRRRML